MIRFLFLTSFFVWCVLASPIPCLAKMNFLNPPKLSLESLGESSSLEKRDSVWHLVSFRSRSKKVSSKKVASAEEVRILDHHFDRTRDWVMNNAPKSQNGSKCQDLRLSVEGAVSKTIILCSKINAHRIFAQTFLQKIQNPPL